MVPLELTPLYSANSWPNRYWHLERNTTGWSITIQELVRSGNALTKLMLENMASKLHDAHIGQLNFQRNVGRKTHIFIIYNRSIRLAQSLCGHVCKPRELFEWYFSKLQRDWMH
jgi:hypothetical protein